MSVAELLLETQKQEEKEESWFLGGTGLNIP